MLTDRATPSAKVTLRDPGANEGLSQRAEHDGQRDSRLQVTSIYLFFLTVLKPEMKRPQCRGRSYEIHGNRVSPVHGAVRLARATMTTVARKAHRIQEDLPGE